MEKSIIDDPVVKTIEVSETEIVNVKVRRQEFPFTESIKIRRVRTLIKSSFITELTRQGASPLISQEDDWYVFEFKASEYGEGIVYDQLDGYGTGNRQLIFKWVINKTGI